MKTEFLSFKDNKCIEIIKSGEVLAFPTETVFGLGAIYDSKEAFDKLVKVKGRSPDKPFTIMISSINQISSFASLSNKEKKIVDTFFPGELTIIVACKNTYPWISLNKGTVGIRMSSEPKVIDLIARVGKPLMVTSANKSGQEPKQNLEEVKLTFENELEGIVVDEVKRSKMPSTIVSMMNNQLTLIRQGKIPFEDIKKVWEETI